MLEEEEIKGRQTTREGEVIRQKRMKLYAGGEERVRRRRKKLDAREGGSWTSKEGEVICRGVEEAIYSPCRWTLDVKGRSQMPEDDVRCQRR